MHGYDKSIILEYGIPAIYCVNLISVVPPHFDVFSFLLLIRFLWRGHNGYSKICCGMWWDLVVQYGSVHL